MVAKKGTVELRGLEIALARIEVVGDTPLIMHAWADKAIQMIRDKQAGRAKPKSEARDEAAIEIEYKQSAYWIAPGQPGFPATAFKAATIGACRQYAILPMTTAKTVMFIEGVTNERGEALIPLEGVMQRRTDMVRLETGVADIRYRYQVWPWRAVLPVRFNASVLSLEQLVNLVNAGGMGGVGEWRPSAPKSSTGDFGRYHVGASVLTA